jgi:hypothetical protein
MIEEKLSFHVAVDHASKSFWVNGPDTNGIWLHYEMARVAGQKGIRLREFDMRASTQEAALFELQSYLSDYSFLGPWPARGA